MYPGIFNMMVQILEDFHLTDRKGRIVDIKNILLIMTLNFGCSVIEKGAGCIGSQLGHGEKNSSYNLGIVNEKPC